MAWGCPDTKPASRLAEDEGSCGIECRRGKEEKPLPWGTTRARGRANISSQNGKAKAGPPRCPLGTGLHCASADP